MLSLRTSAKRTGITLLCATVGFGLVLASASGASADNGKAKKGGENSESAKNSNGTKDKNRSNGQGNGQGNGNSRGNDDEANRNRANDDDFRDQSNDDHDDESRKVNQACRTDWAPASAHRPANLRSNGALGVYVWHDGGAWNVYTTHTDKILAIVQGSVRFDAATDTKGRNLERNADTIQRTGFGADFTFRNYGDLDGIRFKGSCASTITVTAAVNGQPATIFVGRSATAVVGTFTEKRVITPTPVTLATIPAATASPTTIAGCSSPTWNPSYVGAPGNFQRGAAAGLYVWLDGDRLRVETTRPNGSTSVVAGVISVNAPLLSVKGLEVHFPIKQGLNGATFSFTNSGGIDGLELRSPCATQIVISATIDGQPIVTQQVWVGRAAANPANVPLVLTR